MTITMNVRNMYKDGIVLAPVLTVFSILVHFKFKQQNLDADVDREIHILGEKGNHIYISIDHTLCCHLIDQIIVNKHEF